ncbi:alkylation response protein AidB-like acyl-CoA dehydrogenase [Lacibacter cauensis]|uniref:Alkylation response protein AidB-like acyl-CoA dehydrogenase n=1 Tax=Lacibacter cauensis TaxID=510947 RepID=A0A562SUH8_9BACT|nr:acyl-CoA dehydrogenase [Lacibacter cauensis]TWI84955.1 alkylation response protein AidB-like acyl-CoA dehydrogenase [Lacibacter cauensis]
MHLQLTKKEIADIKQLCALSETKGRLSPALLNIIYKKKWFKLFVPKEQGGLALPLMDALQLEEQLAAIDGSLGWTVTLCSGANFFAGFMDQQKIGKLFYATKICMGGSGAVTGIAEQTKTGYVVTGRWKYATGTPHLTHFTANCVIHRNGKPVLKEDGTPLIRSFYFKRSEVKLHNEWKAMGLKATASHSYSVNKLQVKAARSFLIDVTHATLEHSIYTYPFMPFAETTLAVNTLGMTNHLLDEAAAVFAEKKLNNAVIIKAQKEIAAMRTAFYTIVEQSWNELINKNKLSAKTTKQISTISRQLVKLCRKHATEVYPYCGLSYTAETSDLNRVFRDLFTASQHALLNKV